MKGSFTIILTIFCSIGNLSAQDQTIIGRLHLMHPSLGNTHLPYTDGSVYITSYTGEGQGSFIFRNFSGTGYTDRFIIKQDGKVGIGTSVPKYSLDVIGNIGLTTSPSNEYVLTRSHGVRLNNYSEVEFLTSTYGNNYGYRIFGEDPGRDGVTLFKIDYRSNSTTWTNALTLEHGRLGIGTTNPSEMLTVKGTVLAEEVRVTSNIPNSDYVFEPDYALKPLHEVDQFIKENKHLPDIPSAEEFKQNGVGLGEMDNMLLRKVEELTLYVIQLMKENEELKVENQLLKNSLLDEIETIKTQLK
ncbi:MAG: hypothetical protein HC819_13815 [Cyclobacteriaceae bacterium]|nr:hypothetical protein [Cyclobacteriaceae bacterium]